MSTGDKRYHALGLAQLPVWLDVQRGGESNYRIGSWAQVRDRVDHDELRQALRLVAARHDGLRVRVDAERPRLWLHDSADLPFVTSKCEGMDPQEALQLNVARVMSEPMPFGDHPLFRFEVVETDSVTYLIWNFHHIIADFLSSRILIAHTLNALQVITSSGQEQLSPESSILPKLKSDSIYAESLDYKRDLAYWVERFDPLPSPLLGMMPQQVCSQTLASSAPGALDRNEYDRFKQAAKDAGTLPQRVLFALLMVTLARRYGQTDITCGMALHRRDRTNFHVIGMLAGAIPVRCEFETWWSLTECVQAVSEQVDEDLRHQRLPIDALHRELGSLRHGLFDAVMSWMPATETQSTDDDDSVKLFDIEARESSPITLHASENPAAGGLNYRLAVNPDFASLIDVASLADLLREALSIFIDDGDREFEQLSAMPASEVQRLHELSESPQPFSIERLETQVAQRAREEPNAVAVVGSDNASLSYGELIARAGALAQALVKEGVQSGDVVGVNLPRSVDTIIALLAILRVGAVYLPLDPAYPQERLNFMIEDAGASVVLSELERFNLGSSQESRDADQLWYSPELPELSDPDALAYVIYTSGTSGRPKGVAVAHRAVANFALARHQPYAGTGPGDRVIAGISVGFDVSIAQLLVPLLTGACVTIAPDLRFFTPTQFWQFMSEQRITHMNSVPSFLATMLDDGVEQTISQALELRCLILGGELLSGALASRIAGVLPDVTLVNVYGPTEACVEATYHVVTPDDHHLAGIPIGRPLANYSAHVLDESQRPVAIGGEGELYLGGPCLASHYVNLPEVTAERFVINALNDSDSSRLYRTGDRVRRLVDGSLEFVGRFDDQVKIRGHRVEPSEVAGALMRQAAVRDAAVLARSTGSGAGDQRLVAYVTLTEGDDLPDSLLTDAAKELPDYMMPDDVVVLDELPLTVNGKLDINALPDRVATTRDYVAPESEQEQRIADAFADLLELERVGRHDNFFALGGHSLLAVRLAARLEEAVDIAVPIRTLFENPVVANLAAAVDALIERGDLVSGPPLLIADRAQNIPLSFSQERLWFVERFGDQMGANAEVMAYELHGPVDSARLRRVLAGLFARHEALRLRVDVVQRAPVQVFADADDLPFEELDLVMHSADEQQRLLEGLQASPIDPRKGVFWARLVRRSQNADRAPVLLLGIHHMAHDGVSLSIIMSEFALLWEADGDVSILPPRKVQYADFALWQRDALQSGHLAEGLDRFEAILRDPPASLDLPTDRPRPEQPTHKGGYVSIALSAKLTQDLRSLAGKHNASLFMLLESALAVLLSRYARTDDLIIGTVAAGRSNAALEGAVGPFFNMTALRHRIEHSATFVEVLQDTRDQALAAFDDQLVPYEEVLRRVIKKRSARLAFAPLFQVLFQLHNEFGGMPDPFTFGEVTAKSIGHHDGPALHDLTFDLFEAEGEGGGIEGQVSYAADLFDVERIERMVLHYEQLLTSIVAQPDQRVTSLPLMTAEERHRVLYEFNGLAEDGTRAAVPADPLAHSATMADLLSSYARTQPDAPAVAALTQEAPTLPGWRSYQQLDADASRLANVLIDHGLESGGVVGVCLEQDRDLLTTLFAIWKAGAAYLPLDGTYPVERLAFMLEDANASAVVASGAPAAKLSASGAPGLLPLDSVETSSRLQAASDQIESRATAQSLAYLIYTSGSTGQPKGVMVEHAQLMAFRNAITADVGVTRDDCILSAAAPIFDAFFMDLAVSLGVGARMVRLQARALAAPGYLTQAADTVSATYMDLTPSVWRAALSSGWQPGEHMRVVSGGEALDAELASLLTVNGARLYNSYGPTEATVVAIAGDVEVPEDGQAIAIGRPLHGTQAYVLDGALEPLPVGVPGELLLGGAQLARGYLKRPDLTDAAFVHVPHLHSAHGTKSVADSVATTSRLYHTGDLVRWRHDGQLEFIGRIDSQVKIRGMRIELGEIEAALCALSEVSQAVVTARKDADGNTQLRAYLVPAAQDLEPVAAESSGAPEVVDLEGLIDLSGLRASLLRTLPEHMIPHAYIGVSHIALTPSGKADRRALPEVSAQVAQAAYAAPETDNERLTAAAVSQLLNVSEVGRHDDFFALGGHSMMAVRLAAQLESDLGFAVPIRIIFEHPEIADLASALDARAAGGSEGTAALVPIDRKQRLGLSHAQERLLEYAQVCAEAEAGERVAGALRLTGPLNQSALENALLSVVNRHESLRSRFSVTDPASPEVVIASNASAAGFELAIHSAQELDEPAVSERVQAFFEQPFVFTEGNLFRATLLQLAEDQHVFAVSAHRAVADRWSVGLILHEVSGLYLAELEQREHALHALPLQYVDCAAWERQAFTADHPHVQWWLEALEGAPFALPLLDGRVRQNCQHKALPVTLPHTVSKHLAALARSEGTTLFVALQTALAVFLSRYGTDHDVLLATDVPGRAKMVQQGIAGPFENTLALRHSVEGQRSFIEQLEVSRDGANAAFEHQAVPFELLARLLAHDLIKTHSSPDEGQSVAEERRYAPLSEVRVVLHDGPDAADLLQLPQIEVTPYNDMALQPAYASRFALSLEMTSSESGLCGTLSYASERFSQTTAKRLLSDFIDCVTRLSESPEAPLISFL